MTDKVCMLNTKPKANSFRMFERLRWSQREENGKQRFNGDGLYYLCFFLWRTTNLVRPCTGRSGAAFRFVVIMSRSSGDPASVNIIKYIVKVNIHEERGTVSSEDDYISTISVFWSSQPLLLYLPTPAPHHHYFVYSRLNPQPGLFSDAATRQVGTGGGTGRRSLCVSHILLCTTYHGWGARNQKMDYYI